MIKTHTLFLFLILFTSCYRNPDKEMAQVSNPLSLHTPVEQALASSDFIEGSWPDKQWWKLLSDPQLDILIETGISNSPTLQKAEARLQQAEAQAKKVRSKLFPTLDANGDDNWQYYSKYGFIRDFYPVMPGVQVPPKVNIIDLTLNFSYELDFFGKNRKQFAASLGLARAERIERFQAELILASSIALAYFQWQAHEEQLTYYHSWLSSQQLWNQLSYERNQVGIDNIDSPLQQEESLYQIRVTITNLENEIAIDQYILKSLLGFGPDYDLQIMPHSVQLEAKAILPSNISLDLIARRPDLMAQIWRVESARQEVGVAKTEFYPDVNLVAFGGLSSISFPHLFSWGSREGGLQPAIHLPLFTGGKLQANLSAKVASFNEAVYAYNELLLSAVQEVATAITSLSCLQKELSLQQEILSTQTERLQTAQSRYEVGIDPLLKVIPISEQIAEQQIVRVEMEKNRLFAWIELVRSLGGGFYATKQPKEVILNGNG